VLRPRWRTAGYVLCLLAIVGFVIDGWEPLAVSQLTAMGLPLGVVAHVDQLPFLFLAVGSACMFYAYRRFPRPSAKDVASGKF
jgi:hypothetical protein